MAGNSRTAGLLIAFSLCCTLGASVGYGQQKAPAGDSSNGPSAVTMSRKKMSMGLLFATLSRIQW